MNDSATGLGAGQFWTLNLFAVIALVMVLLDCWLFFVNRSAQAEVNARQQYINETVKLSRLNSQVAQYLAKVAVETGDPGVKELLDRNGITYQVNRSAGQPAEAGK